jgi:hypothetical protein
MVYDFGVEPGEVDLVAPALFDLGKDGSKSFSAGTQGEVVEGLGNLVEVFFIHHSVEDI